MQETVAGNATVPEEDQIRPGELIDANRSSSSREIIVPGLLFRRCVSRHRHEWKFKRFGEMWNRHVRLVNASIVEPIEPLATLDLSKLLGPKIPKVSIRNRTKNPCFFIFL